MTITYFNRNTGDTAAYEEPNSRLEALDNWVRVEDGEPLPSLVSDGILSRPHLRTDNPVRVLNPADGGAPVHEDGSRGPAETGGPQPHPLLTTEDDGDGPVGAPLVAQRPSDDASESDWRAYATPLAVSPEAQADVAGMTRDELIDAYGDRAPAPSDDVRDETGQRPSQQANKAAWQAYARGRANDDAERAEIEGLTKEKLVERYGGER
ncbi:hypothetical protein [Streptomyces subrutilus]|uniref:hypothetical protein n=1 Tax=Streptomyces subrutilus TaxID=36818 RepID=UPI002E123BBF|nr:hypothetical protein OG479_32975 [Streptomyces subrutilus]